MVQRIEKIVQSSVLLQGSDGVVLASGESTSIDSIENVVFDVVSVNLASSASLARLDIRSEDSKLDLSPGELRKQIPLLSMPERKAWDKKVRIAKKIKNLIGEEKRFLRKVLRAHGKRKKTFGSLLREIKAIEAKKSEASIEEQSLLKELLVVKEMRRTTTSNFLDDHILEIRVDYDKFLRVLNRVVSESKDERLIEGIKDPEVIPLVAFMSVKTESNSGGFLTSLPDWVVTKDERAGENLSLLGRYVLLETFDLKTARDVEEFEKWDSIEISYLRKSRAVEIAKSAFPELCSGTNPSVRPWNIRGARWTEEGARELAANACAWFLLHYINVVKENGTYDIEKMRSMSEWQKKLVSADLGSMYLNCPDVKYDLLGVLELGSKKLKELGLVNETLVGIGRNQFRPWDFKRKSIPKTYLEEMKARLQLAVKMNDYGLGYLYRDGNAARLIFTKDELIAWAEQLGKNTPYKTLDQLLRKEASTAFNSFAGDLSKAIKLVFNEIPAPGKSAAILRGLQKQKYELVFGLEEFPELKSENEENQVGSSFNCLYDSGRKLASVLKLEHFLLSDKKYSLYSPDALRLEASNLQYELLSLGNLKYKPEIVGEKRRNLMISYSIKIKALNRVADIKEKGGKIISSESDFYEFVQVVKDLTKFHKIELNRILLISTLLHSIKRSEDSKEIFPVVPNGFFDDSRIEFIEDAKILDFIVYAGIHLNGRSAT